MPSDTFTFEEAQATSSFTFEDAIASRQTFSFEEAAEEPAPENQVAAMAEATRATVGVIQRAIAARDFAVEHSDAPDLLSLDQPDEAGMTNQSVAPLGARRRAIQPYQTSALLAPLLNLPRVTSQEVSDALSYLASGSPDLTEEEAQAVIDHTTKPGNLEKIIAGAQRAAITIPESATSPLGIATLGTGILPQTAGRIVSGVFAADLARHIPEQLKQLKDAIGTGDSERITEASGQLLASGAMTALAGKHALTKPKTPLETVAPLTAEAVARAEPAPELKPGDVVPAPLPSTITPLTAQALARTEPSRPNVNSRLAADVPIAKPEPRPAGEQPLTTPEPVPAVPEHLMPSKAVRAILDEPPPTPEPPSAGLKTAINPAPEGGAILGIGGRRPPPPAPVGNTPRGDRNWLRIPSALRRVGRGLFTEGARAVLGRTRNQVGQELSKATRRHVDVEQELYGMHEATMREAVLSMPRQRVDAAMTEASQYFREVENGRPAPALSGDARSLVDAWFAIGRSTGDIARANNVQVFDPALGRHRPMGNVRNYVPRMFTAEVEAVLRDPQADPVLFNRLAQEIATTRGITLEEGAAELRGVAGRFQANDYMANLELARGVQMPELFYEYNLRNLAARYLPSYSERMAQIIAYGQRLGSREAPQRMNLWDIARRESEDAYTQQWLNTAEDQASGFKPKSELEKNARRMQALASASLLSDPTTTVPRNLLSGLSATTEAYGVGRSVRQFREAMQRASGLNARELGAIRDDFAAFLNSDQLGDSALDSAIRTTSRVALNVSGFTGSENFVRTHNGLVASSFARDAAAALAANPASRLSREALAQFRRWDINPEAIIAEGGNWRTGPETRKYIRTAIREMQGGYRFDQVPLWANSTAGRFFYQYGRWGVQRAQNIFKNIIAPAIGEDVTFRGRPMVHRDALPLIRSAALLIGLGETFGAISWGLFGRDRRDASLSEISEAWSEDEKKAVLLLAERIANDIIMAGTLGIIGQPIDFAKSAKDQSRFKNPLDPPSAAGIKALIDLGQRAIDQDGSLTKRDLLDAASAVVRGPKNVSDIIRHHTGESLYEGQNDQRTLRNAARRWAQETGQDVAPRAGRGDIRKSPNAPAYEAINDALLSGDADSARKAAASFIESQPNKAKARLALRESVKARQPFRAGNMTSQTHRVQFMRWAQENLSSGDMEQIRRVQERYRQTAGAAGLW